MNGCLYSAQGELSCRENFEQIHYTMTNTTKDRKGKNVTTTSTVDGVYDTNSLKFSKDGGKSFQQGVWEQGSSSWVDIKDWQNDSGKIYTGNSQITWNSGNKWTKK